jgi:hypothetical protein
MKMDWGLLLVPCLALFGCATPATVQRASDYEICRLSLLRPPLQSAQALAEADRQISVRRLNCAAYAGTIFQQQQEGLNQLQRGLEHMGGQRSGSGTYSTPSRQAITCYKTREWISGSLKNCAYNCLGSEAVSTISAAQVCPISIDR